MLGAICIQRLVIKDAGFPVSLSPAGDALVKGGEESNTLAPAQKEYMGR